MSPRLHDFAAVLLDLDGTIYHEDHPLPGAAALVRRLQQGKTPFACLSNSTTSAQRLSQRMAKMEIDVDPGLIFTAATEAAEMVLEKYPRNVPANLRRPRVFNLATEGVQEMLEGKVDWAQQAEDQCDVVITGAPANIYASPDRQRIGLQLLRGGADLIAICGDRMYPSPRGVEIGSGAFAAMFTFASGRPAQYCGKPQAHFFQKILDQLGVRAGEAVLIGDNLESDIEGGKRVGLKTILTLTGICRREDLANIPDSQRPDWVVQGLQELAP